MTNTSPSTALNNTSTNSVLNNIIFIYGEDSYSSLKHLQAIKNKYISLSAGDLNLSEISGESVTIDELSRQVKALPFLAKKRLVIVRNSLSSKNKLLLENIEPVLKDVPESTILIFYDTQVDKRIVAFKILNKLATVKSFPLFDPIHLKNWIKKEVANLGGTIDSYAIDLLAEWIGPDLWQEYQEINKLISYNKHITLESVQLLTAPSTSTIIFALSDQILSGTRQKVLQTLDELRNQGEADIFLLSLLAGSYRNLIKIALAKKEGATSSLEIKNKTNLHPFVIQKLLPASTKTNLEKLTQSYRQFLDIDFGIKTGTMESGPALDILIARLTG